MPAQVNKNLIPKWFSFKSGIIDNEMQLFQTNEEYREDDHRKSSNRVNQLGNDMLCNYTLRLINQAFDKIQDEK
jgi:translation initiation factor 6 (eIF-6)